MEQPQTGRDSTREPRVDFDHHGPVVASDPVGAYAELRDKCPVLWTESHGGYWVLTKYADVVEALGDPQRFSSARRDDGPGGPGSSVSIPKRPSLEQFPLELDPPRNTPYRKILHGLLSPAESERMRGPVRDRVDWCIDQFIERGSADLGDEFASAVPASFTIDWLGLPHDEWPGIARMMHDVTSQQPGSERHIAALTGLRGMFARIGEVIAERRAEPRDDVISFIMSKDVDGRPVTDAEVLSMTGLLVAGGVDTVTALASQALVWLSEHREDHARLLEDDKFLRSATEEFLRVFSPAQSLARTVSVDTEMRGCPMHDGDRVLLGYGSANRDKDAFPNPHDVVLDRSPNRHVAFGWGVHRCVGANIAHVMFEEMVRAVLRRIPDFQVITEELHPYFSQGLFTGWQHVPVRFVPGEKVGAPAGPRSFRVGS